MASSGTISKMHCLYFFLGESVKPFDIPQLTRHRAASWASCSWWFQPIFGVTKTLRKSTKIPNSSKKFHTNNFLVNFRWLVVWTIFYFPFHIWDNPNPIDSYFSRWAHCTTVSAENSSGSPPFCTPRQPSCQGAERVNCAFTAPRNGPVTGEVRGKILEFFWNTLW